MTANTTRVIGENKGKHYGDVVSWAITPGSKTTYDKVQQALTTANLDYISIRERLPRHAFARAVKYLQENRIIRQVNETKEFLVFQFTKEYHEENEYLYEKETIVTLNKITGELSTNTDNKDIETKAQELLTKAKHEWTVPDISRLIQRLFKAKNADLFPVNPRGTTYFVAAKEKEFLDKIEKFLQTIGGSLIRLSVYSGDETTEKSIAEIITTTLKTVVDEHNEAITKLSLTESTDDIEEQIQKIEETRLKIESYSEYLAENAETLKNELDKAKAILQAKLETEVVV